MCGRFSIIKKAEDIQSRFSIKAGLEDHQPVYNAAPGMRLGVITNKNPERLEMYKWGLVPYWAKDVSIGYKMINARSETLAEKPSFRNFLKSKRCLVPADGFYEWKKDGKAKQPFRIFLRDESLFAFAGLWDSWNDPEGNTLHSFTIITTSANALMTPIHDRMPVILFPENEKLWLDSSASQDQLLSLLKPYPAELMDCYKISSLVNSPVNNSPEVLDRI